MRRTGKLTNLSQFSIRNENDMLTHSKSSDRETRRICSASGGLDGRSQTAGCAVCVLEAHIEAATRKRKQFVHPWSNHLPIPCIRMRSLRARRHKASRYSTRTSSWSKAPPGTEASFVAIQLSELEERRTSSSRAPRTVR